MFTLLQVFEVVSGMKINKSKCGLAGINVENSVLSSYATPVGCSVKQFPFSYLGLPLGGNPLACVL